MQGLVEALYNLVQSVLYSVIVYFMVGFDLNAGAYRLPSMRYIWGIYRYHVCCKHATDCQHLCLLGSSTC